MKSKKLLSIILAGVTALSLMTGCGASTDSQTQETDSDSQSGSGESADTESAGKTLVVYYSATGHTKDVAETIAQVTGVLATPPFFPSSVAQVR